MTTPPPIETPDRSPEGPSFGQTTARGPRESGRKSSKLILNEAEIGEVNKAK